MTIFDLIVIGAQHGHWLLEDINKCKNKIILAEPVEYNFNQLTERYKNYQNIIFIKDPISEKKELKKFYFVKETSINKLKKHWASGIGGFSKQHILNHRNKNFKITDEDIGEVKLKTITFAELAKKYNISKLKKLIIDTEGYDFKILQSINFSSIDISEIQIEFKHLDGTFQNAKSKSSLIKFLNIKNYFLEKEDLENLYFKKK